MFSLSAPAPSSLSAPARSFSRLLPRAVRPEWLTLGVSVFWLLLANGPLWSALRTRLPAGPAGWPTLALVAWVLLLVFNLLLTLVAWPRVLRPVLTVLLLVTAGTAYYMHQYGVMINLEMIRNVAETDPREVRDLLSLKLFIWLAVLGVAPVWLLWRLPLVWRPPLREVGRKLVLVAGMVALLAATALAGYQSLASLARNHRELRFLITPTNVVYASTRYAQSLHQRPAQLQPVGTDAHRAAAAPGARPQLTVLVVGETARADHLSLNGYTRDTTPELAALARSGQIINWPNVQSCGTETAVSLPCMFSDQPRTGFNREQAKQRENLLDIAQRAGLGVAWIDNQVGCKGICTRVPNYKAGTAPGASGWCGPDGECRDEALLNALDDELAKRQGDTLLVLHMLGSHGPAYYKRYPDRFEVFVPVCRTSELTQCPREQIVNAYDNTLRYTDTVLAALIGRLRAAAPRMDTALLYVSDHGESLGENGLYLHGAPYMLAPDGQKQVPMLMWFSPGYAEHQGIDTACLSARRTEPASHDNLFHSMLGLLHVQTSVYDPALDLFAPCRRG